MSTIKKLALTLTTVAIASVVSIPTSFAAQTGTVTVDTLRVRKTPSTSSAVLRNLDKGDKVEIISEEDEWYKVKLDNGVEAYIYADYVKLEKTTTTENKTTNKETKEAKSDNTIKLAKDTAIYILPALFSSEVEKTDKEVTLDIIERINNWVCVEYNGTTGWILEKRTTANTNTDSNKSNTEKSDEDKKDKEETSKKEDKKVEEKQKNEKGYINVSSAFLRKKPSKDAEIEQSLYLNDEVTIQSTDGDWYKVKAKDKTGYVFKDLVSSSKVTTSRSLTTSRQQTTKEEAKTEQKTETKKTTSKTTTTKKTTETKAATNATGADVVKYAKKFNGYRYVYGGSGPKSFDCSGFTMYVYKHFGVKLPHNAETQANYGKYVKKSNLKPGDLVIFNNRANTSIGHAGVYIGNGKFIHAANSTDGVTIDTLNSGYYSVRFVEGRRLI